MAALPDLTRVSRARLDPNLREWIDRVIVPILVHEYLAQMGDENRLASKPANVANCSCNTSEFKREVRP